MTRAEKALVRAEAGYREARNLRDPIALHISSREYARAVVRVDRQRSQEAKRACT